MVRTKKHFRPPSSSSSSSSSEDEEPDNQQSIVGPARGGGKQLRFPGGGKQLSMMANRAGGGKQLRPQEDSEKSDDSDDSSDDDEEEEAPSKPAPATFSRGGGKQLYRGGGKQLRPQLSEDEEEEDSDDDSDEDEEVEEEKKAPAVYRPPHGGKGLQRNMGKQLRPPPADEDSSESSESEYEAPRPPGISPGQGGKMLRPTPAANEEEESADDMEESEDEAYEEPKAPSPKPTPSKKLEPESESESESEPEPELPTRSTRSTKKIIDKGSSDSESSSSSEEEQEWDMETFDTQKLVQNETDKEYLDSLPELEREAILAERFEKLKSEADMKKALRENKRKEREQKKMAKAQKGKTPEKKRGAPAKAKAEPPKKKEKIEKKVVEESEHEDEEDKLPDTSGDAALAESMYGKRVSTRNLKAQGNKYKKAAALQKIRENRAIKAPEKEEPDSDLDYGRDSDDSDDDYEESTMLKPWQQKERKTTQLSADSGEDESVDEEDKDFKGPKGQSQRRAADIEADVEDYSRVAIPRRKLIRWCNEPFFEDAVKHFYVRLGIGRDMKTQKACYRLCRIVGVVSKSEYSFPPTENQKPVSTDKWLKVSFGKSVNTFKMITVSDHRPSADDVAKYVSQLKTERQSDTMLLKKTANKLCRRQDELVNNYTYTKEDIENLIKEKKKRSKKASNIGMEKTLIANAVQAARDAVEEAKLRLEDAKVQRMEASDSLIGIAESNVTKAKEALEDANVNLQEKITEQQRIHKDEHDRINKLKKSSKVQNWVKVNQRAKLANQDADFQSYKEHRAREQAAGSAEPKFDPYARRKVKPKNLWEVGAKDKTTESKSNDAVQEEKKDSSHPSDRDDSNTGKDGDKENKRNDIPETPKVELPGQTNQFAYDDEIMIGGDITNIGGLGAKKSRTRVRKGISLDDYQERKSAGTL